VNREAMEGEDSPPIGHVDWEKRAAAQKVLDHHIQREKAVENSRKIPEMERIHGRRAASSVFPMAPTFSLQEGGRLVPRSAFFTSDLK